MGTNAFGQPLLRKEDTRLLTGRGVFTADLMPPGPAHAVMLRSPHPHARIRHIDVEAARAMPGVLAVLTGADYAAAGLGGVPNGEKLIRHVGTPSDQDYAFRPPPRPALAQDIVRYAGETVAMVVAERGDQALDALEQISVDYEILPSVTETENAIGGPPVWSAAADNVCFRWSAGQAEAVAEAFDRAAHISRVQVVNNRVVVGAMETRGALGTFEDGRYILDTGSQMPHKLKAALSEALHVPGEQIRVRIKDVGGSFGIKNALYPEQILVLWAARMLGRPVGWLGERSDSFLSDYQARDNISVGEMAMDAQGRFLALRVTSTAAIGAWLAPEGQLSPTSNTPALAGVYRLPAIHVSVTGVFTHSAPTEVYRGAGRPEAIYLLERLVEQAACDLRLPSIELRRRNLLTPADLPFRTGLGLVYDSGDFPAMLTEALQRADHGGYEQRRSDAAKCGLLRGFGIAHYCERVAGAWAEDGWVTMDASGRITLLTGTMSNGQGHETAFAQLLGDQLGLDPADIVVIQGDTDLVPSGHGTGGSASLAIGGAALAEAGHDLVRKAIPLAADALEAAEADITFEDGAFRIIGTDRTVGLQSLAQFLGKDGRPERLEGAGFWKPSTPTFPNGCHIAEVEIDPQTGALEICRYTMLHDFGRVLNPMLLEGQLQGGVTQGIGQAAQERVVYDPQSGQVLSGSLMDYQLPRAADLPALVLHNRPTPSPFNPLGVKGCGEAGAAGAAPAVVNAVLEALRPAGVTAIDMPVTPERIWRALNFA